MDVSPKFSPQVDFGGNFRNNLLDLPNIRPTYKQEGELSELKRSGAYIKLGGFYNFRTDYETRTNFPLGCFFTSVFLCEEALFVYNDPSLHSDQREFRKHELLILGIAGSAGLNFKIFRRFSSNLDFQLSVPQTGNSRLFFKGNFIPGMGYLGMGGSVYPMIIFNLKYGW
jgi:hypothetical protein